MRLKRKSSFCKDLLLLHQWRTLDLLQSLVRFGYVLVVVLVRYVGGFPVAIPTKFSHQCAVRLVDSYRSPLLSTAPRTGEVVISATKDLTQQSIGGIEYGNDIAAHSSSLGNISRVGVDESHSSLLEAMGIPTFVCSGGGILDGQGEGDSYLRNNRSSVNLSWSDVATSAEDYNERYGPAFTISSILSDAVCEDITESCETAISVIESLQSTTTSMNRNHMATNAPDSRIKNHHGAMQLIVSQATADTIADRIAPFIPLPLVEQRRLEMDAVRQSMPSMVPADTPSSELLYVGLNRRFRVYKYAPNAMDRFAPHIDAGFPPSSVRTKTVLSDGPLNDSDTTNITSLVFDDTENVVASMNCQMFGPTSPYFIRNVVSRLTVLFYLNDQFLGGETNFYQPLDQQFSSASMLGIDAATVPIASVRPRTGSCLIFPQCVGEDVMESYARSHWPMHEGSPVQPGSRQAKYVIRSDLLFAEVCRR
jgi:hypothetical protein